MSIKKLNKFLRLNKIFLATDKKFKYVYNAILQSIKNAIPRHIILLFITIYINNNNVKLMLSGCKMTILLFSAHKQHYLIGTKE